MGDGRGFVVAGVRPSERLILTAAHCLPSWPVAKPAEWDTLQKNLVAPLGAQPSVWADCQFVDPVGDLAILGSVDGQEFPTEADAFERLVEGAMPLPVGDVTLTEPVWLLALDGEWFSCPVEPTGWGLILSKAGRPIVGGMSGSPIVQHGAAVGLVSGAEGVGAPSEYRDGYAPRLVRHLPGWLLHAGHTRNDWRAGLERQRQRDSLE